LSNFFRILINGEVSFEKIRQRLLSEKDRSLSDFFKMLDQSDNNFVTQNQLKEFLREYGICVQPKEVKMLVERFTKSVKGRISYIDFVKTLTPKSPKKYS